MTGDIGKLPKSPINLLQKLRRPTSVTGKDEGADSGEAGREGGEAGSSSAMARRLSQFPDKINALLSS